MNKEHPLFDQSIQFLKNSGDVPVPKNANERFETTAVLLKEIYTQSCTNEKRSMENEKKAGENRLWLTLISGGSGTALLLVILQLLGWI